MPLTLTGHPTLAFEIPDASGMHRTQTQRASQNLNQHRSQHRTHTPDGPVCTGLTPRELCKRTLHRTPTRTRPSSHRMRPVSTGRKLREFHRETSSPDEAHRTLRENCFRVRCLNSDASDLIPDASGLTALRETNSNFFPCIHVPTPKCLHTCARVLAFSPTFFQGSSPLNLPRHSILTRMQS